MPVPSKSSPRRKHHRSQPNGRPSTGSVPGPPAPEWSFSRAPTPITFEFSDLPLNSDTGADTYQPTLRGLTHSSHARPALPPRHHAHPPVHRPRSPSPALIPLPTGHHSPQDPGLTPQFQYSKCTGIRRALCIGVNYTGQKHALRGCINDAKHVFSFLVRHAGYKPEDIVVLTDDSPHPRGLPTRKNIIDAMQWLVRGTRPHDALFFHYSGHGGQTPDLDGDEVDGYDDVIYPVDYRRNGHIADDQMHDIMVRPLPAGCRLTAVFDSCYSGTALDLPYIYNHHGRLKGPGVSQREIARKASPADVILLSGCKDGASMDAFVNGTAVGAASHAFIKAIEAYPHQSYREFMHNVRLLLYPKFSQKPQLSSSHPIDTSLRFIL
ncbi:caspase domain-containing protein [Mycena filopes]|nr:caspase domain-containing protein [Mycena filopes]